jgi:hypothetical protein
MPCFTPGIKIATPVGEVPVENLRVGDGIVTRDNGVQQVRWVGQATLDSAGLAAAPHLKPMLIRQGSMGRDVPERDMMLSPNHRILVANDRTALYFEASEVLVAAKHLSDGRMIVPVDVLGVTYVHFLFEGHEVVLANGAWTESFQPEDETLGAMGNAQRTEMYELFPALRTGRGGGSYKTARRMQKRREGLLLNFSG